MAPEKTNQTLEFPDTSSFMALTGASEANLRELEGALPGLKATTRGSVIRLSGEADEVEIAIGVLDQLYNLIKQGYPLYRTDIDHATRILKANARAKLKEIFLDEVFVSSDKRVITPKSPAQKGYIDAIRKHDIVFGVGPAGTGKTFLAMAMAVAAFTRKEVRRIILCRPAVEAGEKLGYLPGSLHEKVDPYLRPLYDALHTMIDSEKAARLVENGSIEVAPLAFMRGRTLDDSFVILDEAQNTTPEQMKMFLTRLGFDSKAVITGDVTQIDLPTGKRSGLVHATRVLNGVRGIAFSRFSRDDVVRHPLVQKIIDAYDRDGRRSERSKAPEPESEKIGEETTA